MKTHKKTKLKSLAIGLAALSLVMTSLIAAKGGNEAEAASKQTKAKNVVLFVGDGMGAAARDAIRLATVGEKGRLAMESMPYVGLVHTSSTIPVTDSAAAATAFASGVKTYNGAIGVDANKKTSKRLWNMRKKPGNRPVS